MSRGTDPLLVHPGPAPEVRIDAHVSNVHRMTIQLPRGSSLLDTLAARLSDEGVTGAVGRMSSGSFRALAYVNPAHCTDGSRAVTFSEPIATEPPVAVEIGNLTLGLADGVPFVHCHAVFTDATGRRLGGHVIPEEAVIDDPIEVTIDVFEDVAIEVRPDEETGFTLFQPRRVSDPASAAPPDPAENARGVFARVRPHEDLNAAVEELALTHQVRHARVQGIGSIVGATYVTEGGEHRNVPGPALEVLDLYGEVEMLDSRAHAELTVCGVDIQRELSSGPLAKGENPVAVTYELALLPP